MNILSSKEFIEQIKKTWDGKSLDEKKTQLRMAQNLATETWLHLLLDLLILNRELVGGPEELSYWKTSVDTSEGMYLLSLSHVTGAKFNLLGGEDTSTGPIDAPGSSPEEVDSCP